MTKKYQAIKLGFDDAISQTLDIIRHMIEDSVITELRSLTPNEFVCDHKLGNYSLEGGFEFIYEDSNYHNEYEFNFCPDCGEKLK